MSATLSPNRRSTQKTPREPPPPYAPPLEISISPSEVTPSLVTPSPSPRRSLHRTRSQNATETSQGTLRDYHENEPLVGHLQLPALPPSLSMSHRTTRYFQPLVEKEYWLAALHLGIINFPFALVAWIYLFVGTLVGTTLLLLLPFGFLVWWMTLVGARAFTRWELKLQDKFHLHQSGESSPTVPYRHQALRLQLQSPLILASQLEAGQPNLEAPPAYDPSFLQTTYAMFLDPVSYQPLFYFIVIKGATTLLLTPIVLAVVPVSLVLIFPAPLVLRAVRRVGRWQADLAMEGLGWFVLVN
ncbi:hypothetical protein FRB94_001938 [Tulasnella sp. JGI-2019a]|nr:hypothetical protein FRB93_005748 [Tulasnella sp. JGI-2019a]KAG9004969.1 hypothetical protein FRB94_001938 [Tulasnella sp. JGI-2019a]KAG9038094.1 hypothetical protein FRB95_003022 [Tulasnella sp. JGI-2019a]